MVNAPIIRLSLVLTIWAVCASDACAGWKIKETTDSMTDKVKKTAYVENSEGHSFSIYRIEKGGPVWGNFSLSNKVFDQIDPQKPPLYRVDKNPPTDLSRAKQLQDEIGIQAYGWEPKWVNFLMWHGKESGGISADLINIMTGKQIVFRYYLSTGGYKETSFDLEGAREAINNALGIRYAPSQDEIIENQIDSLLLGYQEECRKKNKSYDDAQRCIGRATDCRTDALKVLDITVFKKCFESNGP